MARCTTESRGLIQYFLGIIYVAVLSLSTAYGEEAGPLKADYQVEQVSEHVFVVHGPTEMPNPSNQGFMNNPGFVITGEGVVVIDAGSSIQVGKMVVEKVSTVTDAPIIATISTHIHGDHWLGNQAVLERYPEAKMYAHPDLIERAHAGEADSWLDLMLQLTNGATAGTVAAIPDLPINDGDVLEFGNIKFSIHHKGQAHTHSDIAIIVQPDNTMFTGDLVFNKRLGRMDDGHFTGLLETLDYLLSLAPKVVVPGHGQTSDASAIEQTRQLYGLMFESIETQFDEGLSDFEMKDFVVEHLSEFSDWSGFEDGIGRMISLGYLEIEENSF